MSETKRPLPFLEMVEWILSLPDRFSIKMTFIMRLRMLGEKTCSNSDDRSEMIRSSS